MLKLILILKLKGKTVRKGMQKSEHRLAMSYHGPEHRKWNSSERGRKKVVYILEVE